MSSQLKGILLFVPLFLLVIMSAYNWHNSLNTREYLMSIEEHIKELKSVDEHLLVVMSEADEQINNDEITAVVDTYTQKIDTLKQLLDDDNSDEYKTLLSELDLRFKKHHTLIEHFKSKHTLIKNSLMYLIKVSEEVLHHENNLSQEDPLYLVIVNTLFGYFKGTLPRVHPQLTFTDRNKMMLTRHINVVYQTHNDLQTIQNSLENLKLPVIYEALEKLLAKEKSREDVIEQQLFWIMFFSSLLLIIVGIVFNYLQIKAKNVALNALSDMEQFANALDVSAIVSKTNLAGTITYVNENFCRLSGYSKEELIGKKHNIVRHPDMDRAVFQELWETITAKKIFKATIKNRTKSGNDYYVDTVAMPLLDVNGNPKEYIAVRYDVTELVKTRDKAVAAQIAKDEFFSNMSHELRTPLNAIIGFAQLLSINLSSEKEKKQAVSILSSGTHLLHLINDILDLSKMASGKFSIHPAPFHVNSELNLLLSEFDSKLKEKGLEFEVTRENLEVTLIGDWLRVSQIIINILGNAVKFTGIGGLIQLDMRYEEDALVVIISDSGIGMDETALSKVFESFEQADTSTTREYGGTGLGLSITQQLIDLMKGKITVTSKKGEGTQFSVKIPMEYDESVSVDPSVCSLDEHETKQFLGEVLVAEDNKTNQLLIMMVLEEYGLGCDIANDGVEAVSMSQEKDYDLILMDENMPNVSGITALHEIRALGGKVPVVALTANAMKGDEERFMTEGMDGFIPKPIDSEKLLSILEKYLQKH